MTTRQKTNAPHNSLFSSARPDVCLGKNVDAIVPAGLEMMNSDGLRLPSLYKRDAHLRSVPFSHG